jgi:hypothetical protein
MLKSLFNQIVLLPTTVGKGTIVSSEIAVNSNSFLHRNGVPEKVPRGVSTGEPKVVLGEGSRRCYLDANPVAKWRTGMRLCNSNSGSERDGNGSNSR